MHVKVPHVREAYAFRRATVSHYPATQAGLPRPPRSILLSSLQLTCAFDLYICPAHCNTMDIPLFGDAPNKRRREINLGGNHSATSYNDIVSEARLRRLQRNDAKRRIDAATQIQSSWRGYMAKRDVRRSLRATFDQDICSTTALRCLVLLGQDEDALGRWSTVVTTSRKGESLPSQSRLFLIVSQMFLCNAMKALSYCCDELAVCSSKRWREILGTSRFCSYRSATNNVRDSRSKYAPAHISALTILLSDNPKSAVITQHLISRGFYSTLRNAILQLVSNISTLSFQYGIDIYGRGDE